MSKNKHHTSIFDKSSSTSTEPLLTTRKQCHLPSCNNKNKRSKKSRPTRYEFREFLCLRSPFRLFENRPNRKRNKNNQELNKLKNLSFVLSKYKIILGANDFTKTKIEKSIRVGKIGELFAKLTKNRIGDDVPR